MKKTTEKKDSPEPKTKTKGRLVQFALDKETKGSIRFKEVDDDGEEVEKDQAVFRTIYVRKSFLKEIGVKGIPDTAAVTINF